MKSTTSIKRSTDLESIGTPSRERLVTGYNAGLSAVEWCMREATAITS